MSDSEAPEVVAFRELSQLVGHLGDELATFRRRALVAEARLRELEGAAMTTAVSPESEARVAELERENATLRVRLERATARTAAMIDRVHFLRQQAQQQTNVVGGGER